MKDDHAIWNIRSWGKLVVPLVLTFVFNAINFRLALFSDWAHFIVYTGIFFVLLLVVKRVHDQLHSLFLQFFPKEEDAFKRLSIQVIIFILISGLLLNGLFHAYGAIPWFNYTYNNTSFAWNFIIVSIINIFDAFLKEGLRSYKEWRLSRKETESLDAAYTQSRLNALKSQVNPHFLFNSLNSLSSLIHEDEEKAEFFLNELTKVYRYMLRHDDELWVTLDSEVNFVKSYKYILTTRYGDGLQINIAAHEGVEKKLIAPHSLQVIIENAFTQNIVSKASPLKINVDVDGEGNLLVTHNVQPKTIIEGMDQEAGLDDLVKKYALLGTKVVVDESDKGYRSVVIPLINVESTAV